MFLKWKSNSPATNFEVNFQLGSRLRLLEKWKVATGTLDLRTTYLKIFCMKSFFELTTPIAYCVLYGGDISWPPFRVEMHWAVLVNRRGRSHSTPCLQVYHHG